jgi:hypothetical protein
LNRGLEQGEEVSVMALNKDIVKLLIIYIIVTVLLCLVDFASGEPTGLNKLAGSLGLKTWGSVAGSYFPCMHPNILGLLMYLIMGIAVAFGLSYIYPNFTLKKDERQGK